MGKANTPPERICLAVCAHYAEEVRACAIRCGCALKLATFPARCGRPPLSWEEVGRLAGPEEALLLVGGCCLAGLQATPAPFSRVRLCRMELCQEMVADIGVLRPMVAEGAYLMTPGWLADWRKQTTGEGEDPDCLRALWQESASSLVCLDTGTREVGPELEAMAASLGLPAERKEVGLQHLRLFLEGLLDTFHLGLAAQQPGSELDEARQQAADRAVALEFLSELSQTLQEEEVRSRIVAFFTMLFGAEEVNILPANEGELPSGQSFLEETNGFQVRLGPEAQGAEILQIRGLAFPRFQQNYLNLTLSMSGVCALGLCNARSYQALSNAQASQRLMLDVLDAFSRPGENLEELDRALAAIQGFTGASGVAVRLANDWADYRTRGFPEEHRLHEQDIRILDALGKPKMREDGTPVLACLCGEVLSGHTPRGLSQTTIRGGLWTNHLPEDMARLEADAVAGGIRQTCVGEGFHSLALLPLRSDTHIIGLLQVAFLAPDALHAGLVELLEGVAGSMALGLERRLAEDRLRAMNAELEERVLRRTRELAVINESLLDEVQMRRKAECSLAEQAKVLEVRLRELGCLYDVSSLLEHREASLEQMLQDTVEQIAKGWPCDGPAFARIQLGDQIHQSQGFRETPWQQRAALVVTETPRGWVEVFETSPIQSARGKRLLEGLADLLEVAIGRCQVEHEKAKVEQQLLQMQKLEAIGTLAGGIAHDFNNILTPILAFAELGLSDAPPASIQQRAFEMILKGGQRARDLVNQILLFSRKQELAVAEIEMGPVVKEGLKLIRASLPSSIEIRTQIDPTPLVVMADPTQLHQIVMNLCTNAFHAMEATGGVLEVSLQPIVLEAGDWITNVDLMAGRYALLQVSDTGHGMTREVLARIFEPFFTTKAPGKGTGLGLSVVHGLVKGFHGDMAVYSEPGQGTTFRIYLPTCAEPAWMAQQPDPVDLPRGHERILVVDDDEGALEALATLLRGLDYQVETATGALEGLALLENHPDEVDLVITDLTLPQMTGLEMAAAMQRLELAKPVILCSGYSQGLVPGNLGAFGVAEFIQKPYTLNTMAQAVRRVLGLIPPG